jgi:hypothetical protein
MAGAFFGRHSSRLAILLKVLITSAMVSAPAQATVTVGLHFVEGEAEPIDFLANPFTPHFIEPWQITAPGNQFVVDGAFAGWSEEDVRATIVSKVKDKFYSVPTPNGYVLDIEFMPQQVSGAGTVNVLLGNHYREGEIETWFGFAQLGGGLGNEADGSSNAAVSIDRIDSLLQVDFLEPDHALNAIAHVTAHETAHLFWLDHVWADDRTDLGWAGEPVVENPYDVMATGPSGLPESGWIQDNAFTTVPGTQTGDNSSVDELVDRLGLRRIGDTDLDGDVDNSDILTATSGFTGSGAFGTVWADGDVDFDGDVDNADIIAVAGNFTGARPAAWWTPRPRT